MIARASNRIFSLTHRGGKINSRNFPVSYRGRTRGNAAGPGLFWQRAYCIRGTEIPNYYDEYCGNLLSAQCVCQQHHQADYNNTDYNERKIIRPLRNYFLAAKSHGLDSQTSDGRASAMDRLAERLAGGEKYSFTRNESVVSDHVNKFTRAGEKRNGVIPVVRAMKSSSRVLCRSQSSVRPKSNGRKPRRSFRPPI